MHLPWPQDTVTVAGLPAPLRDAAHISLPSIQTLVSVTKENCIKGEKGSMPLLCFGSQEGTSAKPV